MLALARPRQVIEAAEASGEKFARLYQGYVRVIFGLQRIMEDKMETPIVC